MYRLSVIIYLENEKKKNTTLSEHFHSIAGLSRVLYKICMKVVQILIKSTTRK